ncbi:centromere protein H (CENP-H) domain-containing protein [Hirsutella rhossiliensis]|uniref:Centromere protein H (CENP-H) domain-containing protein n=1 Tax=Hirsutella rhossiliensis TaxID=111463 RepID=A0A9P8SHN7_9HYPO|nr:centromere protein H (CENP-H) domain-containing protein [Hirsutella rhossiliensis]KAH0963318.1 centromere protein H (CENP-H) domain-containing protein [Hirsutella rhossiliensis]
MDASEPRADHDPASLPLPSDEQRALDLFDSLQQLRLETAMANALASHRAEAHGAGAVSRTWQEDLLDARAKLKLRNDAVEAVVVANPILKAVHNGTDASPVERDLLPYVERRDEAVISVARQAADMEMLRDQLTRTQADAARVSRRNVELAAMLCDLADKAKRKRTGSFDSPEKRSAIARLENEVASRRKRWRVIKGVASGVVSGSGIDWARDDELCDMVLDPENEDERP